MGQGVIWIAFVKSFPTGSQTLCVWGHGYSRYPQVLPLGTPSWDSPLSSPSWDSPLSTPSWDSPWTLLLWVSHLRLKKELGFRWKMEILKTTHHRCFPTALPPIPHIYNFFVPLPSYPSQTPSTSTRSLYQACPNNVADTSLLHVTILGRPSWVVMHWAKSGDRLQAQGCNFSIFNISCANFLGL